MTNWKEYIRQKTQIKLNIREWNAKDYAELAFVLYFSLLFWTAAFGKTLSFVGLERFNSICACILAYAPLIVACIKAPRKYIKWDAILLYVAAIIFFVVSYLLHPENKQWFVREQYGAFDYVFWLRNGLYAYLFVRLIDKPEDYFRLIKIAAFLMYIYFFYEISVAVERGYWEGVANQDAKAKLSYSVSFGYNVLFFSLPFLYDAIKKHRVTDIIMAFIGVKMMLDHGARGSMFCLIGFLVIVLITHIWENREIKRILLTYIVGLLLFAVCSVVLDMVVNAVSNIILPVETEVVGSNVTTFVDNNELGDSRFVAMVSSGEAFASNGRFGIWNTAVEMIKENPWGYGAFGARPEIAKLIVAGYPHNLLLDIWIEFGVIIGSVLFIAFAAVSAMVLFRKGERWKPVFICAFSCACALFISFTFWAYRPFWVTLAIVVNCFGRELKQRRMKKKVISVDE